MLHPTTILFACYNSNTSTFEHIDISFLNERDSNIINAEINRMASVLSEDNIFYEDMDGIQVASTTQYTLTGQIDISRETALVMTKLAQACSFWKTFSNKSPIKEDISSDMLLMKIDAFPSSVYRIVYDLLYGERISSKARSKGIQKLYELLKKINLYNNKEEAGITGDILHRIEKLSSMAFWRELLSIEYMRCYKELPPVITLDTMNTIKKELKHFDIYGFVPPNKVYEAFRTVEDYRKNTIHISDDIVDFLMKIVRSGGIRI